MLYQLPEGWVWTTLGEIGIVVSGGTPSTNEPQFWKGDIPWITPADLSNHKDKYIAKGIRNITQEGLDYSSAKLLPKGSILFTSRAPIGYVVISKNEITTNQGFKNIIPTKSLYSDYVYYYLKSVKNLAEKMASGTTFLELSATKFSQIPIPFSPLSEQYKIVAKIEELFSELEHAEETLLKSLKKLKIYKKTLLRNAFEGRLTKKWRKDNFIEPSKDLLQRIKVERENQYETELRNWKADSQTNKKPAIPKQFKIIENELNKFNLPINWTWTNVGELAYSMKNGIYKSSEFYTKNGIPCLRMYNIFDGKIVWHDIKRMNLSDEEVDEFLLKNGDLLVNRVNSRELVGKTARIADHIEKCVYESKNIRLRLVLNEISHYLNYWFLLSANNFFDKNAQQTAGMASINQEQLASFPVPLPNIQEQNQIVQEIETRFALIDNLESSIIDGISKIEILRTTILKNAFEGKLIPQGVIDESAMALLQRINFEKGNYLQEQIAIKKVQPKTKRMSKKELNIIEILQEAKSPMPAKDVWQASKYKNNIEDFYAELKKMESQIKEDKIGTESFLSIRYEN